MRVLILEDDENRIEVFNRLLGEHHELHVTKDPQIANDWLKEETFDFIFLDHDLAPEHYDTDCDSNETTGLCVAEFLGNNKELSKHAQIVVHSLNPDGCTRMMRALYGRNAIRHPFNSLMHDLKG